MQIHLSVTGHSFLYYDEEKISDYGKKLLTTTFVYNPAEFQMNTAFAKAFIIDSFGTKRNCSKGYSQNKKGTNKALFVPISGERGIQTLGTVTHTTDFETVP